MKIVILGAAGRTGRLVVQQALDAGHEVTAFVRPSHPLELQHPQLTVQTGDARSYDNLTKALLGSDAVISTVSSNKPGGRLISESTAALIKAMRAAQIKRVILMSSFLVGQHYQPGFVLRLAGNLMKGMLDDKTAGEDLLESSELEWTIVHATLLTNGPLTGHNRILQTGETASMSNKISRADVAGFMINSLADKSTFGRSITITTT